MTTTDTTTPDKGSRAMPIHVLIASRVGQRPGDTFAASDGEPVRYASSGNYFAGFDTALATSTAMVVERDDLTAADYRELLAAAAERGGWHIDRTELDADADELLATADAFSPGDVLELDGDHIRLRAKPSDTSLGRPSSDQEEAPPRSDTTSEAVPHRYTFDAPAVITAYVTATTAQHARDKLTGELVFGLLLDTDAGDGIFLHQAASFADRPPVLMATDDNPDDNPANHPANAD